MLANKGHWFLFTVDTVLQCPASVDQNSHWGEAHHFLLSSDYRPSVGRPSTERWPITDRYIGEVSVKYRWTKSYIGRDISGTTIDRVSTECRPTIVLVSTDYRPTIDRYIDWVSTDYRPTIYRYIDRVSTDFRLSVDRVSTDYRSLYRPIDQSTLLKISPCLSC